MIKKLHLSLILLLFSTFIYSQIKSGPMLGHVDLRTAYLWCEIWPGTTITLAYWKAGSKENARNLKPTYFEKFSFKISEFYFVELEPGTAYEYQLVINNKLVPKLGNGTFKTQELWKFRKDAPNFAFLAGSCNYVNEPIYDRSGRPYGGDSSIFFSMAKEEAALMLWLGDNWYYRDVDYGSEWGLWYRASRDRSRPVLQPFFKSMSHYAIWDDHDYGPNNAGIEYIFKDDAKQVFNQYWCNPGSDQYKSGIYTKFSYNDVDFFMMDCRSFRTSDNMNDSLDGMPNEHKAMWGNEQMFWLQNQLLNSNATFKIIANGSPVLNLYNDFDCMAHFTNEFQNLLDFIVEEKIEGVLFFTGDRHHSDIVKKKLSDNYTIFDICSSSLTAGIYKLSDKERTNPDLLTEVLVEQNNYTKVSITGKPKDRKLKVEFKDVKGNKLKEWEVHENQLKFSK